MTKYELLALAQRLREGDGDARARCVRFLELSSEGVGHGRVRALLARRLKHEALAQGERESLVEAVLARLVAGRFAEQFRDQLRLALALDRDRTRRLAAACLEDPRAFVREMAEWVLRVETR